MATKAKKYDFTKELKSRSGGPVIIESGTIKTLAKDMCMVALEEAQGMDIAGRSASRKLLAKFDKSGKIGLDTQELVLLKQAVNQLKMPNYLIWQIEDIFAK